MTLARRLRNHPSQRERRELAWTIGTGLGGRDERQTLTRSHPNERRARRRNESTEISDQASIEGLLERTAAGTVVLNLVVADIEALRLLTHPRASVLVHRLSVTLGFWEEPRAGWRGRARAPRGSLLLRTGYDPGRSTAQGEVHVLDALPLFELATSLLPAFAPTRGVSGAGFPALAVGESAPWAVLNAIPGRLPRPVRELPSTLHGIGLHDADIVLTEELRAPGTDAGAELIADALMDVDATAADGDARPVTAAENAAETAPELPEHELRFDDDGIIIAERSTRATIDLLTHNPIGRLQSFQASPPARSARIEGDVLLAAADGLPSIEIPLDRSLPLAAVRRLRSIEAISLAGLVPGPTPSAALGRRLAELSATGVILHDLPDGVVAGGVLTAPLEAILRRTYRPSKGLERELRSVEQRRAAMHGHAGFLCLSDHVAQETGQRLLPRVSVVLSSIRPERVVGVLRLMAAQRYPYFEVIVVMHGVPAPDLTAYADELAELDYRIVAVSRELRFGSALAEGVRASSGDLVTKADDDDWYGPEHLWDLVLAHLYSEADVVGKTTEYLYFEGIDHTVHRTFALETYHEQVAGGAMMLARSTLDSIGGWRPTPNSTDRSILLAVHEQGGIAYRAHSIGYQYIRHSESHTWVRSDSQLLNGSYEQWPGQRRPEVGMNPPPAVGRSRR